MDPTKPTCWCLQIVDYTFLTKARRSLKTSVRRRGAQGGQGWKERERTFQLRQRLSGRLPALLWEGLPPSSGRGRCESSVSRGVDTKAG
jgi:hypothetical protein